MLRKYIAVDASSPTGLTWCKSPHPRFKVGSPALTALNKYGYYQGSFAGVQYKAHRVVFFLTCGYWPEQVDHVDGNRANNSPDNLREATHSTNQHNKRVKGYYLKRGRYYVRIMRGGGRVDVGNYATEEEARLAYLRAKKVQHPTAPARCYQ